MLRRDGFRARQVGDGARDLENPVVCATDRPMRLTAISSVRSPASSSAQMDRSAFIGRNAL
jgi:hypothetical protein